MLELRRMNLFRVILSLSPAQSNSSLIRLAHLNLTFSCLLLPLSPFLLSHRSYLYYSEQDGGPRHKLNRCFRFIPITAYPGNFGRLEIGNVVFESVID